MPRGRKRDEDARQRILDTTFQLVGNPGDGKVGINEIAEAAGVAKQTIYRWWPSRTAVVLDALVAGTMKATPFPETHDLRADFTAHLRGVIRLFNSPTGSLIRELLAESQTDRTIAHEFRDRFWRTRRELSTARLARGVELGQVRRGLDHELVLDAIYGPLWVRLIVGHVPMRRADATRIVDIVWSGIANGV
jgi:AcrR family transcriptional regulator